MTSDNRLNLSRRSFILSLLSGLVAAATLQGCGSPYDRTQLAQLLSRTIGDPAAAKRFGDAYLLAYPDEAGIDPLVDQIDAVLIKGYGQGLDSADPKLLAEQLAAQIKDEYRRGEAIQVDGWILSRSEARLYALIALL